MSKKDKKKLNKKVTAFVKLFDDGVIAKLGKEFEYSFEKERVLFPLEVTDRHDEQFSIFIKKMFGYDVPNTFMMSLLHELGHHFTGERFSEEDEELYLVRNEEISERLLEPDCGDQPYYDYYALPQEMAATAWAVDVYRNNEKAIQKEWKKIKKALTKYEKERLKFHLGG